MGGFHFGHRYINDVLPYLYWSILVFAGGKEKKPIPVPKEDTMLNLEESDETIEPIVTENNMDTPSDVSSTDKPEIDAPLADYTYPLHMALCALGLALNVVGTIAVNMGWV